MFWPWHSRPQPTLTYRESDPSSHQLRIVYLSPGIILVLIHDLSTTVATLDIQVEHPLHTPTKPKAILTSVSKSLAAHRSSLVEKKGIRFRNNTLQMATDNWMGDFFCTWKPNTILANKLSFFSAVLWLESRHIYGSNSLN